MTQEKYNNKLDIYIPKDGEDTIRYRDGHHAEIINLETGISNLCFSGRIQSAGRYAKHHKCEIKLPKGEKIK